MWPVTLSSGSATCSLWGLVKGHALLLTAPCPQPHLLPYEVRIVARPGTTGSPQWAHRCGSYCCQEPPLLAADTYTHVYLQPEHVLSLQRHPLLPYDRSRLLAGLLASAPCQTLSQLCSEPSGGGAEGDPVSPASLTSSPATLSLTDSAPAVPCPHQARGASGPLHLLSALPRTLFPQRSLRLPPSLPQVFI